MPLPEQLTRMCHEAWVHHRTAPEHVDACVARNPHKPGAAKLRRAQRADVLLSDLERGFVRLLTTSCTRYAPRLIRSRAPANSSATVASM